MDPDRARGLVRSYKEVGGVGVEGLEGRGPVVPEERSRQFYKSLLYG